MKKKSHLPYQQVFLRYGFSAACFASVWGRYYESHRFYHDIDHLTNLLEQIETRTKVTPKQKDILIIAALFHDAIYDIHDPAKNEIRSAELFDSITSDFSTSLTGLSKKTIRKIILDTSNREEPRGDDTPNKLSRIFWRLDNSILNSNFADLMQWERKIFKEWQAWPLEDYRMGRIQFLRKEINRSEKNAANLEALLEYVKSFRPRIGVYPGSFNPFHVGHLNVLQKAEKLFDKVILLQGVNPEKAPPIKVTRRNGQPVLDLSLTEVFPKEVHNRQLVAWKGMTHEFLQQVEQKGADAILIRGLRNGKDLDYEVNQLRFTESFYPDVKVAYVQCDKEYEHISSSAIRNILKIEPDLAQAYLLKN